MRRSRATIGVRRSRNYWNWCLSGWKPEVHLESKVLFTRGQGLPEHFRHCVELFSPDPRIQVFVSYALSPDGELLAAVKSNPTTVLIWEVTSGKKLQEWRETNFIYTLAFSPD